jgi:hypothetical protein
MYNPVINQFLSAPASPLFGNTWLSAFVIGNLAYSRLGGRYVGTSLSGDDRFYKIIMNLSTGFNEINGDLNYWTIYPNPVIDFLTSQTDESGSALIEIYSSIVEKVNEKKSRKQVLYKIISENNVSTNKRIQIINNHE